MTIIKHSNQRVGVLIDAQNLYHSAQNLYGSRVNFTKVLEEAVAGRVLVRAIAYVITSESGEESTFFEALETAGIETKAKDLQVFSGGAKKADWDVGIAVDAIKLGHSLDAIVIASGDGDFIPAVQYVQHATGCQVEVISFGRSTSSALIEIADDFVDMGDDPEEFLMVSRTARRHNRRKFGNKGRVFNGGSRSKPSEKTETLAETKDSEVVEAQKQNNTERVDKKKTQLKTTETQIENKSVTTKKTSTGQRKRKQAPKKDLLEVAAEKPDTSKPRVSVNRVATNTPTQKTNTKNTSDGTKQDAPAKKVAAKRTIASKRKSTSPKKRSKAAAGDETQKLIKKTPAKRKQAPLSKPGAKATAKKTPRKRATKNASE